MADVSLVSVNIERSKHLDVVERFLAARQPDVVCLQELMEGDVERLAKAASASATFFVPMGLRPQESNIVLGIGILSRHPVRVRDARYYHGDPAALPDSFTGDASTNNAFNRVLAVADIEKDGATFRIATTHFTWSQGGAATDEQRRDMTALLGILDTLGEFILCGDFNAPRGGEIFALLASKYKDNIPPQYKTSLDLTLHRAGKTHADELSTKMVDGLFSTPGYAISDIELIPGVSDHCAIVATIAKTS